MRNNNLSTIFIRDQQYRGPHIVQTFLKKEKSSSSFKLFNDQNTRFFTLNMQTFEFYYTPRDQYQTKDIKQIDIANIKSIVDRGCKKNSKGQNKEWTFQLSVYFNDKYTLLYCQNETMKQLWMHAFKCIIRISDNKPLLYCLEPTSAYANNRNNSQLSHLPSQNQVDLSYIQNSVRANENGSNDNIPSNRSRNSNGDVQNIKDEQNEKHLQQDDIKSNSPQQIDQRKSSGESCFSNSSERKKKKTVFKDSNQKRNLPSQYKQKKKCDDYFKNRVIPKLQKLLERVRKRLAQNQYKAIEQEQLSALPESDKNGSHTQNTNNLMNEVDVQSLDYQNPQTSYSDSKKYIDNYKVFKINNEKQQKKVHKVSPQQPNVIKKNKIYIFDNVVDDKENDYPTLNIQLQQERSQNGWDGNDIDLLQDILRQNSLQLKDNNNDIIEKQSQNNGENNDLITLKQQNNNKILNEEPIKIQKAEQNKKENNGYEDWDIELDNILTPITKQTNLYENSQVPQLHQNNQYQNNWSRGNVNQQQVASQFDKQKAQVNVAENNYDNWDDDM